MPIGIRKWGHSEFRQKASGDDADAKCGMSPFPRGSDDDLNERHEEEAGDGDTTARLPWRARSADRRAGSRLAFCCRSGARRRSAARRHGIRRQSRGPIQHAPAVVGRAGPAGRLVQRRHRRHSDAAARAIRQSAVSHRAGIRGANEAGRARRRPGGENSSELVSLRLRATRVSADVADRRSPGRQAAGLHARRHEAPDASRHVRQRAARQRARLLALRALHHARHRRLDAARRLRQRAAHRAVAGYRSALLRDGARHSHHLYGWPAARQSSDTAIPR